MIESIKKPDIVEKHKKNDYINHYITEVIFPTDDGVITISLKPIKDKTKDKDEYGAYELVEVSKSLDDAISFVKTLYPNSIDISEGADKDEEFIKRKIIKIFGI